MEVAAIDPIASMQAVNNPNLERVAEEVRAKLQRVIDNLWGGIMRSLLAYLIMALVVFSVGLCACSKKKEEAEPEKGAIEKMTDEVAHTAVKKIRTPIDQAHSAKAAEEERAKAMDKALQEQ